MDALDYYYDLNPSSEFTPSDEAYRELVAVAFNSLEHRGMEATLRLVQDRLKELAPPETPPDEVGQLPGPAQEQSSPSAESANATPPNTERKGVWEPIGLGVLLGVYIRDYSAALASQVFRQVTSIPSRIGARMHRGPTQGNALAQGDIVVRTQAAIHQATIRRHRAARYITRELPALAIENPSRSTNGDTPPISTGQYAPITGDPTPNVPQPAQGARTTRPLTASHWSNTAKATPPRADSIIECVAADMVWVNQFGRPYARDFLDRSRPAQTMTPEFARNVASAAIDRLRAANPDLIHRVEQTLAKNASAHERHAETQGIADEKDLPKPKPEVVERQKAAQRNMNLLTVAADALFSVEIDPNDEMLIDQALSAGIRRIATSLPSANSLFRI